MVAVLGLVLSACGGGGDVISQETGPGAAAVEVGGGEGQAPGPAGDRASPTPAPTGGAQPSPNR